MHPVILTFHTDPGHGWLETTIQELMKYGIHNRVSAYSYRKGDKVYLEEDCDANLLLNALRENKVQFAIEESGTEYDSFVRRLNRFTLFI